MSAIGVPSPLDGTRRLRKALQEVGDALARADLRALLDAEVALVAATSSLPLGATCHTDDVSALRHELAQARAALLRCRRLGNSMVDVARTTAAARGARDGYGRDGQERTGVARNALEASA